MNTRAVTLRVAAEFWESSITTDKRDEKGDWPTRAIWTAGGIAGAGFFFGSFGFLAMPFIGGWSWLAAWGGFIAAQWTGSILMDLHTYWVKAASFLWIGWNLVRGNNVSKALVESGVAEYPAEAAPAT